MVDDPDVPKAPTRSLGWKKQTDYNMVKGLYTVTRAVVGGDNVYTAYWGDTLLTGRWDSSDAAKAYCDDHAARALPGDAP